MLRTETVVATRETPVRAAGVDRNETPGSGRVQSIDIVRGAVMLLMAIDHVRIYSGLPAGGPTPGIFLTRWITHFVAPAFIFWPARRLFCTVANRRIPELWRGSLSCVACGWCCWNSPCFAWLGLSTSILAITCLPV